MASAERNACVDSESVLAISMCALSDDSTSPNFWALVWPRVVSISVTLVELGAHLGVHLVESGIDDVLLRAEVGRGLLLHLRARRVEVGLDLAGRGHELGVLAFHRRLELLALEERRLLEGGLDRGIALGRGLLAGVGDGTGDRGVDRGLHRLGGVGLVRPTLGGSLLGAAGGEHERGAGCHERQQHGDDHHEDQHGAHHDVGVLQSSRTLPPRPLSWGFVVDDGVYAGDTAISVAFTAAQIGLVGCNPSEATAPGVTSTAIGTGSPRVIRTMSPSGSISSTVGLPGVALASARAVGMERHRRRMHGQQHRAGQRRSR